MKSNWNVAWGKLAVLIISYSGRKGSRQEDTDACFHQES